MLPIAGYYLLGFCGGGGKKIVPILSRPAIIYLPFADFLRQGEFKFAFSEAVGV
jgi:hypothetical protein